MRDSQLCALVDQLIGVVPASVAGESDIPVRYYEVIADQYAREAASIKGTARCLSAVRLFDLIDFSSLYANNRVSLCRH